MRWDEMIWDEMRWDEMRWGEMRWDEMRWDEMRWYDMIWDEMGCADMRCDEMIWDEMRWDEWDDMRWAGPEGWEGSATSQEDNLVRERRVGGTAESLSIVWSVAGTNIPAVTFISQAGLANRELAHTPMYDEPFCTSASLRDSTRISSEFALRKHSSPSLGS